MTSKMVSCQFPPIINKDYSAEFLEKMSNWIEYAIQKIIHFFPESLRSYFPIINNHFGILMVTLFPPTIQCTESVRLSQGTQNIKWIKLDEINFLLEYQIYRQIL